MSKFSILLKINLINSFKLNKVFLKKKGSFNYLKVILAIFGVLAVFMISFVYLLIFADILNLENSAEYILPIGISAGILFTIFTTMSTANSYLFKNRDFDLLMSLPIKSRVVISSKFVNLLIINYITFAIVFFPTMAIYEIYNVTTVSLWLLAIPTFILVPLLPITISSFLSYLFGFITPKLKYKNIIIILFSLISLITIMTISMSASSLEENPGQFVHLIKNNILFVPGIFVYSGMVENIFNFLIFAGLSIIPFIGFIYLIGKTYLRTNARSNSSYVNKNFKMTTIKTTSQNKALIKKEIKRYFGSPMYVLNTIVGPILATIMLFSMYFNFGTDLLGEMGADAEAKNIIVLIFTGIFTFMLGITSTTAASISIEGKQFWILKSLPVSEKQVFKAKAFINLMITIPFIIIDVILAFILFDLNIFQGLFMLVLPSMAALFMSYMGLYINLLFPRFDYESDVKAVKQSLSVIVTMFAGFTCMGLIVGLGVIGIIVLESTLAAFILPLVGGVSIAVIFVALTYTHGVKIYKRLNP